MYIQFKIYRRFVYSGANDLAMNMQEQKIILFSDFDSREISFATTSPGDKKMLHLEVYPGSWFDVKIAVTGNGDTSAEESYTLKPHEWNGIDIDLTGFLSPDRWKTEEYPAIRRNRRRTQNLSGSYLSIPKDGSKTGP